MSLLRTLGLPLLALALLAGPAAHAQTRPASKASKMSSRKMAKPMPMGKSSKDPGISGYAAPGEPINVQENGKNTPPYDGSAAKARAPKGTTMPRQ